MLVKRPSSRGWTVAIGKARLIGGAIGIALLGSVIGASVGAAAVRTPPRRALYLNDAVIDFGRGSERVSLKLDLDGPANSKNTDHFYVRVIVTDRRDGMVYDSQDVAPTVVR
jgi:hypothetical protein